jgi:hypothetical protein
MNNNWIELFKNFPSVRYISAANFVLTYLEPKLFLLIIVYSGTSLIVKILIYIQYEYMDIYIYISLAT